MAKTTTPASTTVSQLPHQPTLKELIREEYKKCAMDAAYFMKKYCWIQHPKRGKIKFELYEFQERTLKDIQGHRFNIVLKSRQLGISTLVAGYSLWLMLFHSDKSILVIATKQKTAINMITKVHVMHSNLPSWMRGSLVAENKQSLEFKNGSVIKAESSSPEAGRSESLSLLVLDEAAFIKDINEIWGAASPTLSTGGDCILLSTPNGVGNLFHKIWKSAEEGDAFGEAFNFNPIKLKWDVHPERDIEWRKQQDDILGPRLATQECDCDFVTSGRTVIDGSLLKWYEEAQVIPPIRKEGVDEGLWIWKYPDPNKTYLVAADTARGDGDDAHAAQVLCLEDCEQVAEYRGMIGTKDYGNFLVELSTKYNDSLLVVENANYGWAVLQQIIDREYKNLFYSSPDMMIVDIQSQIQRNFDQRRIDNTNKLVAGISMTQKIRPLVVSKIDEYFRYKQITIHSKRLISELFTFIYTESGRPDHLSGYNDDTIISMGIGLLVQDTAMRLKRDSIARQKRMIEGIRTVNTPVYKQTPIGQNPYLMKVAGMDESISWLIDTPESVIKTNQPNPAPQNGVYHKTPNIYRQ